MRRLVGLVLVLSLGARAAEVPPELTFVIQGQPAPFTGDLLPPAVFQAYLHQQLDLELCQGAVKRRDEVLATAAERTFLERHGFALGLALGFAGAIGLTWGTVKVLTTAR